MSLDTATLTGTNIPDIAARNVEKDIKTFMGAVQVAVEAFFVSRGISATFYNDGIGTDLRLSAAAVDLLAPIVDNTTDTAFPAAYWTDEEERINTEIETIYGDQPVAIVAVGHP